MLMVPENPYPTDSRAEKRIFDALNEAFHPHHAEFIALHSFKLSQHTYKPSAEIDFLICCPHGLFALEIKGGRVSFNGQHWGYMNREGHEDISYEGPFRQAESAMYSLRQRLSQQLTRTLFNKIIFGYGVILPDCRLSAKSMEWDEILLCQDGQHRALEHWLKQLIDYWCAKKSVPRQLSADEITVLMEVLRPKQVATLPLHTQVEWVNERITQFTEQQLLLLDAVEANLRVICSGSAGTGKTLMAMELARRWTSAGKQVLVVCRSLWLKQFLTAQFRLPNLTISTLEGLPMAVRRAHIHSYDALLVDEGQDVLDVQFIQQVEPYLTGGFAEGRWVFFHDINNQAGLFGVVDPQVFAQLQHFTPVQIPLRRNCRNTANILDAIREYTHADMAVEAVGAGPSVKVAKATDAAHLLTLLQQSIAEILDHGGLPAAELTILTNIPTADFMYKFGRFLPYKVAVLDDYAMQNFPPNTVSLTTVNAFKGLENTAVILCLNQSGIDVQQQQLLHYVGISRARALLHIFDLTSVSINIKE